VEPIDRILPPHIEETIRSIARLQSAHDDEASSLQRRTDQLTAFIGRPQFMLLITWIVVVWIGLNVGADLLALTPFDPPPFNWLQGVLAVAAIYITTLILATQRYADQLAGYREQLTLELAILTEQKTSKLIELVEEQRRDNPNLKNRVDIQAEEMGTPTDPEAVLEAIKDAHEELDTSASSDNLHEPDAKAG
jgi:uncharacterized membrane protein